MPITRRRLNARAAIAAGFIATVAASGLAAEPTAEDPYRRLGDDARRVMLCEIETKPFDFAQLAECIGWTGEAITPETLGDRVLVVLARDQHEARSVRLLPTLARLERTMGDKVVCLALHTQDNWDDALTQIEEGRVRALAAHDASGEMLKTLVPDEHPNLYLVDKSGHVRTADLDPRDLPRAIAALARETREEAQADLPRRITALAEARSYTPAPTDRPTPAPTGTPQIDGPAQPGGLASRPDARAYAQAEWPDVNPSGLNAIDVQGKPLPVALGNETWLSPLLEKPLNEHVIVLDFWATWCGPCIRASPTLDAIQRQYAGQVQVIGMSGQASGNYAEDEASIRAYMLSHPVAYAHANDTQQRVYNSLRISAIPHVVVISTDGIVRWQGNPLSSSFRRVVNQVVEADPLLAARRAQAPASEPTRTP